MKRFGIMTMIVINGLSALANPIQVAEARDELRVLQSSLNASKQALKVARDTYNLLDTATDRQKKALAILIKLDHDKEIASQKSIQNIGMNPYYSDAGHASGNARLLGQTMEGS